MKQSTLPAKLRTGALMLVVCVAGSGTAVAMAKNGADDGTSTGTTGTTGTTTTPSSGAPSIREIEVDSAGSGKLRLRAQTVRATSVRFTYRGRTYKGTKTRANHWSKVVTAREGDGNDTVVKVRVKACNGSRCVSKTGSDDA